MSACIFKQPEQELQVGLKTDGKTYGIRKKVKVDLNITNQNSIPKMANLSIAV